MYDFSKLFYIIVALPCYSMTATFTLDPTPMSSFWGPYFCLFGSCHCGDDVVMMVMNHRGFVLDSSLSGLGFSVPPSMFIVPAPLLPFQNIFIFYFWQNVVHWRREWRTTSVFFPWAPNEQYERWKGLTLNDELPRLVGAQYATGEEWRNNSRKNEEMEQSKNCSVVDVTGDGSKVRCCKGPYFIGTWNVRFMNQGKLRSG